jgi:hypothetical protein
MLVCRPVQRLTLSINRPIFPLLLVGITGPLLSLQRTVHCMMSHAVVSASVTSHLAPSGENVLQFAWSGHDMPKQAFLSDAIPHSHEALVPHLGLRDPPQLIAGLHCLQYRRVAVQRNRRRSGDNQLAARHCH